ncbi:sporulation protein [Streptomyces sp. 7-21]|jgi:sporulation-control protein|nr:sporulation protein [Streptomyces sp. 7-21]
MVFKKLLASLGVGGPSVDTVLDGGSVLPGSAVSGQVMIRGGNQDVEIQHVTLHLVARVEIETDDAEYNGEASFGRFGVSGGFALAAEQQLALPFTLSLPWETPVTELYGRPLGIALGVRTELAVAGAVDKGDLDPLAIRPLPVQQSVLEALGQLGFTFRSADLEQGHIRGTGQTLPFYQEIELSPGPQFAHALNQLEVTFLTSESGVEVVLEGDKRRGLLGSTDVLTKFTLGHHEAGRSDMTDLVGSWVNQLASRR